LLLDAGKRLIDATATDFDVIRSQFRCAIPRHLNVAYQVCERHQREPDRVAIYD
jgi:hypothetical protein